MYICEICKETWLDERNKRAFSVCCFTAVYALPVLLVLTAYVRMSCRLCTPSVIVHNRDGETLGAGSSIRSVVIVRACFLFSQGGDIILNRDSRLLQSRRRVARTLLILAFVFAACWLPYHIVQLVEDHLDPVQDSSVIKTVQYSIALLCASESFTKRYVRAGERLQLVARPRQFRGQPASLLPVFAQHSPLAQESLPAGQPKPAKQLRAAAAVATPRTRHEKVRDSIAAALPF